MKNHLLLSILLILSAPIFSQNYNTPESVEFDYVNNRWFISNNGDGTILTRSSLNGTLSVFASGIATGPHGLEIRNDTLYVCDGPRLLAYNINTPGASPIFSMNLGATFLNGITNDNGNNLYITDFSAKNIYRFNIATRQYNVFASTGTKTPNGIIFDASNNRCVFVTWGASAAIMQLNLVDSTVTTAQATTLSNCDGISRDLAGNYYISSWGLNGITKFSSTLLSPTTVVSSLSSPADIFYNTLTDTLGVPNSGSTGVNGNKASFHFLGSPSSVLEQNIEKSVLLFPNPCTGIFNLSFHLPQAQMIAINLYNGSGQLVEILNTSWSSAGENTIKFKTDHLAAGVYSIQILSEQTELRKQLVIGK